MKSLETLPDGVNETLALVERFDEALLLGFARLGDDQRSSVRDLSAAFQGGPLGSALSDAAEALAAGEFTPRAFLTIAAARGALLGAVHDALVAQVAEALHRPIPKCEELPPVPPGGSASLLAGVQHWLTEIAIAGFKNLDESSVAPFLGTLENLQEVPEANGLAVLMTGFVNELLRNAPTNKQPTLPIFRWADLWSAALTRTRQLPGSPSFRQVSGEFTPFGIDVGSHGNFVAVSVYGRLSGDFEGTARLPFSSYRVDVVSLPEVWDLFEPRATPVLRALAEHRTLNIEVAELRANGDLILGSPPTPGRDSDPFEAAEAATLMPPPAALSRHPAHIAEVVKVTGPLSLPVASERIRENSAVTEEMLRDASESVVLLRFDRGGWRAQPLCSRKKKGFATVGEELLAARLKLKNRSLDVLKERSSRLLRKP